MIKLAEGEKPTALAAPAQDTRNAPSVTAPITARAKDVFGDNNNLIAMLAAAGGSGMLGGYLSSKTPGLRGETPGQRRKRIILNALAAGGAGGAAMGGGLLGASMLKDPPGAQPQEPGLLSKIISPFIGVHSTPATIGAIAGNRFGAKIDSNRSMSVLSGGHPGEAEKLRNIFGAGSVDRKKQVMALRDMVNTLHPRSGPSTSADFEDTLSMMQRAGLRRPIKPLANGITGKATNALLRNDLSEGVLRQFKGKRLGLGVGGALLGTLAGEGGNQLYKSFNE